MKSYPNKLLELLQSVDEKSVAVGLEIIKGGHTGFEPYLADYTHLYACLFGVKPSPLEAKHLVLFNQTSLQKAGRRVALPPAIKQLPRLESLTLYMTGIELLPAEIGQLDKLLELKLNFNNLTQLPAEVGNLTQLKIFWLHSNQLKQLPAEIGKLHQLQELDLSSNQLNNIPEEMGNLTQLKELSLEGNQLTSLPPSIAKLSTLQKLYLSRNPLPKALVQQVRVALPGCEVFF